MEIIIHRGAHVIGDTCIEVNSTGCRILIDMGTPLMDKTGGEIDERKLAAPSIENGILPDVKGLYRIAKHFGPKVFIGIRGGENALRSMDGDEIKNRDWNISTEEKASPQWITGELFYKIISEKNVF